jgi:UDP-arabinose 4-epimerase
MTRSILVTGGAGYIGSHACKALSRAGYRPVTYDNLSCGHAEAVRWGPLVIGDIRDPQQLGKAIQEHDISAVMHFAAFAYVGESVADPSLYYRNNVNGTLSLLDTMREHHVETIVFSSTCATYGMPETIPIREVTPQLPVNPYGETKLAIERALHWYGEAYGIRSVALRYFNAAGGDPGGETGESHFPETHLIPLAIRAALVADAPLEIYGTDYPTPDGSAVRDYIHVQDLAEAHVAALEYLAGGGGSDAFNFGIGHGHTVREVISAVEKATGMSVSYSTAARRAGDPPILIADPRKAFSLLGWQPLLSDLETIVRTAAPWQRRLTSPSEFKTP